MNPRYRIVAMLLVGVSLAAFVAPALAANPNTMLIAPGEPYGLPKYGFSSSTIHGYGERIVSVRFGGRAARLGLEPGDVILSMNGHRLAYSGSWNEALSRALYNDGGMIRLRVRDVRTGGIRVRETYLGYGNGPVEHYYKAGIKVTPHVTLNHNGITLTK